MSPENTQPEIKEAILNKGYLEVENNVYQRDGWTIRLDNDFIEVFNEPVNEVGKYYIQKINRVNICTLLDTID